jgi:5-methylcytosine-specific restriction endonuclease McrA
VLRVAPWKDAVCLEYQGKGLVLERYPEHVKTVKGYYQLPAVIVIKDRFVKFVRRKVKMRKKNIFIRDKFKCAYCGQTFDREKLTVDHVYPKSKGGKSTWDNLVTACILCNRIKGDTDKMKPLWKPYEPKAHQVFIVGKIQPEWRNYIVED